MNVNVHGALLSLLLRRDSASTIRSVGVEGRLPDAVTTSSDESDEGKEDQCDKDEDSDPSAYHGFSMSSRTHVSIQEMTTRPLTMLHLSKASPAFPQLIGRVRAVKEAAPMRNRMKAMAIGTRCAKRPKATWWPIKKNPGRRTTKPSAPG